MAHQAHHLPWETLASNFKFSISNRRYGYKTNLFPLYHEDQTKRLLYFLNAFNQTLRDFSDSERTKYSLEYTAPEPDDVVLTLTTARKIKKTLVTFHSTNFFVVYPCEHTPLPLSPEYRRMSFWINAVTHKCKSTEPYCNEAIELTKTLILHNELETLLQVTAHPIMRQTQPRPGFDQWWTFPEDHPRNDGWCEVMRCALMSYICLNVFYLKPNTYDKSFQSQEAIENQVDYRSTSAYQKMLVRCTGKRDFDIHTYPHREFFGVIRGRYHFHDWQKPTEYGLTPLSKLEHEDYTYTYAPTSLDIPTVEGYLRLKGLPPELIAQILQLADYKMKRRLIVADDPLHPDNAHELRKYLNYCWQLLIRTDIVSRALGQQVEWKSEITECIWELWGESLRKMVEWGYYSYDDRRGWRHLLGPQRIFV
jgi:hypothetical protein